MDKKIDDVILLKTFPNRGSAEIAKSALAGNGINAFIQGDDAGGMYPFMTEGIRLFINKKDEKKATTLLPH
jgi:hypothetical protein